MYLRIAPMTPPYVPPSDVTERADGAAVTAKPIAVALPAAPSSSLPLMWLSPKNQASQLDRHM